MGMGAGGAMGMGHYGGMMHPMQMQGLHAMGSMGYLPQQAPQGRPAPSQSTDAGGAASSAGTSQARPCSVAVFTYAQTLREWPAALGFPGRRQACSSSRGLSCASKATSSTRASSLYVLHFGACSADRLLCNAR